MIRMVSSCSILLFMSLLIQNYRDYRVALFSKKFEQLCVEFLSKFGLPKSPKRPRGILNVTPVQNHRTVGVMWQHLLLKSFQSRMELAPVRLSLYDETRNS